MVTVSTLDTLGETLQALLAVAAAALADTSRGTPDLQYLSPGLPIQDFGCDHLIGFAGNLAEETTTPIAPLPAVGRRYARYRINLPTLSIELARCFSVEPPVTEAQLPEMTADGLAHCQDGWALWNGVTQALRDGGLLEGRCDDVHLDALRPLDPARGLFGWTFTIRPSLDGIPGS